MSVSIATLLLPRKKESKSPQKANFFTTDVSNPIFVRYWRNCEMKRRLLTCVCIGMVSVLLYGKASAEKLGGVEYKFVRNTMCSSGLTPIPLPCRVLEKDGKKFILLINPDGSPAVLYPIWSGLDKYIVWVSPKTKKLMEEMKRLEEERLKKKVKGTSI